MGYAYSIIKLLEESTKKYIILTSNEEPVIIDNISQIIKDCISQDIGIVSPVFFKFGKRPLLVFLLFRIFSVIFSESDVKSDIHVVFQYGVGDWFLCFIS